MKFLVILQQIVQLLPLLVQVIKTVEDAIPGQGKGEQKLVFIRSLMEQTYTSASDAMVKFEDLWPALSGAIGALVTAFNNTGVFKRD